jgi:hypothetical protein
MYRHRRAILLSLIVLLIESYAGSYTFNILSNASGDYRSNLEFLHNEQNESTKVAENNDVLIMRIEEGPNGTKNAYVEAGASLKLQVDATGETFDFSAYTVHITFWSFMENIFNTMRDVQELMFETTLCIFIMFSFGIWIKRRQFPVAPL